MTFSNFEYFIKGSNSIKGYSYTLTNLDRVVDDLDHDLNNLDSTLKGVGSVLSDFGDEWL